MQSLFEFPKELKKELRALKEGYLSGQPEIDIDKYVRKHGSHEFIACWEKNMKRLQKEREKSYIIN